MKGTILLLTLLALANGTSLAATCSPDNDCSNCADKSERLKCKFDRMTEDSKKVLDNMETLPNLTAAQLHGIGKAKERMDREKNRRSKDDFKLLAKKRSAKCQLVEYSGDGDGVCDIDNEECAEVIGDGIGDDTQPCSPMKGKKREVCAKICDDEAVLLDEGAIDDNAVGELEGLYDTMSGHIDEVNATIPDAAAMMRSVASAESASVASVDPCAFQPPYERHTYEAYKKARWAAVGSRSVANVAERFCDQAYWAFFGSFSGSAACAAGEGVVLAMSIWWDTVDLAESSLDAQMLDAAIACAAEAASNADKTALLVDEVQVKLNEVRAKNAEILRLLAMPPGQREGYPAP
jgi:hypothetical protein